eukprot:COSAG01_NODE_14440_length_1453_cov_61.096750_1_plen_52_part_00
MVVLLYLCDLLYLRGNDRELRGWVLASADAHRHRYAMWVSREMQDEILLVL